jgi:hypothetical protein
VTNIWLHLRSSLATPPGQAAQDGQRQATYVACILQFEQLVHAAKAISSHTRPLPLYYAAMQASRALVASFGVNPHARGHGLTQADKTIPEDVMQFQLTTADKPGLFQELCVITQSDVPEGRLALTELFLSLPELVEIPNNLSGPRSVYAERVPDPTEYEAIPDPFVRIMLETEDLPGAADVLQNYPTLQGWHEEDPMQRAITSRRQSALVFRSDDPIVYRDRHDALGRVAPTYRYSGQMWVRTAVGLPRALLSPLVSWYALLNGFSVLARYEPDAWVEALDPRAPHAAAIDGALDQALDALPDLLWKEISTRQLHQSRE